MNEYFCPKCNSPLKISNHIILKAKIKGCNTNGTLILFEPKLGDFQVTIHPKCKIDDSKQVEFFCPLCQENLGNDENDLAKIKMN